MFGKKRTKSLLRLHAPAEKGATEITVEKDLDLVAGDRLGLLPTSFCNDCGDDIHVKEYDASTGIVKFERDRPADDTRGEGLMFYHWGAEVSTAEEFGTDMRGEALLLTRNIKVVGEDVDGWGAQMVSSDNIEFDSEGNMKERYAHVHIDSVEFYNCSQIDTFRATIRFENAAGKWSKVSNSALHNGLSWGVAVKSSENILLKDNVLYNFRPIGIAIGGAKNVTLDGNAVGLVQQRTTLESLAGGPGPPKNVEDKEGGILGCTYWSESEPCKDLTFINNIVGGAFWVGFTIQGHECGGKSTSYGNVAHSVAKSTGGVGFLVKQDFSNPKHGKCLEASGLIAYKNEL